MLYPGAILVISESECFVYFYLSCCCVFLVYLTLYSKRNNYELRVIGYLHILLSYNAITSYEQASTVEQLHPLSVLRTIRSADWLCLFH